MQLIHVISCALLLQQALKNQTNLFSQNSWMLSEFKLWVCIASVNIGARCNLCKVNILLSDMCAMALKLVSATFSLVFFVS